MKPSPYRAIQFPLYEGIFALICTLACFIWLASTSVVQSSSATSSPREGNSHLKIIELSAALHHINFEISNINNPATHQEDWQQYTQAWQSLRSRIISGLKAETTDTPFERFLSDIETTTMVMDDLHDQALVFLEQDNNPAAQETLTNTSYSEHKRLQYNATRRLLDHVNLHTNARGATIQASTPENYIAAALISLLSWIYFLRALLLWRSKTYTQQSFVLPARLPEQENSTQCLKKISHDLRTPLNSLLIYAEELANNEKGNLTNDQVFAAKTIYANGYEFLNMVNESLAYSKHNQTDSPPIIEEVSIAIFIEALKQKCAPIATQRNLKLSILIDRHCPQTISTYPNIVEHVLWKLVSNACAFSSNGKVRINVQKAPSSTRFWNPELLQDSSIAISVEDQGMGIQNSEISIINAAFDGIANNKDTQEAVALGTGLTVASNLSNRIHGELHAQTGMKKGAKFTLFLPISLERTESESESTVHETTTPEEEILSPPEIAEIPTLPSNISKGEKILVIEDDLKFQKILGIMMSEKSMSAIYADTGLKGFQLAKRYLPAAIILDIELPDISGTEVLARLKADPETANIPVYIMSIYDNDIKTIEGQAIGYLTKPVNRSQLNLAFDQIKNIAFSKDKSVLVVEDNDVLRNVIERLLKEKDIATLTAASGEEAMEIIKINKISCMILDLGLPKMSGLDVLDAIAADPTLSQPHVIVYTGNEISSDEEAKIQSYTDNFILKNGERPQQIFNRMIDVINKNSEKATAPQTPPAAPATPPREESTTAVAQATKKPEEALTSPRVIELLGDDESLEAFSQKTVLIVDDDKRNIFALSRVLKGRGMLVVTAEDGKQALELLEEHTETDIVLMDIMMPVMDGYEAIERIRAQDKYKDLPVLAVTAKAMQADKQKCLAIGANDYISKPIDKNELYSQMKKWLSQQRA
jgi:CheY-like chemotaxis protein